MNTHDIANIKELLSSPKKIVIVSHRNPDGDAYGSSLALYHYLKKYDHSVTVISPNDCPEFLKWLPAEDNIVVFESQRKKATGIIKEAEVIFTLDFNALHRVGDAMEGVLKESTATFIMIDHHKQPEDYATYMYSDVLASSTSQMMYHFIEKLDDLNKIDKNIATCLYTGIVTDTGSFKYQSTTGDTHRIVANLLEKNIDHTRIHNELYDTNSIFRLQLLGKALSNLRVLRKYKTAYITLSQEELNSFHFKKGDTEGFVNYGLSLKGVVMAAIFIEDQKQGIVKMSFRSKGNFCVNEFARNYFNGGGHENAAGGRSEESLRRTVSKFIKVLEDHKEDLLKSYEE